SASAFSAATSLWVRSRSPPVSLWALASARAEAVRRSSSARSSSVRRAASAVSKSRMAPAARSRASASRRPAAARAAPTRRRAARVDQDGLGLILGHGEDLLDPRAEVAEGDLLWQLPAPAQLRDLVLKQLHLSGQRLNLLICLLALGGEGCDLRFRPHDVVVD